LNALLRLLCFTAPPFRSIRYLFQTCIANDNDSHYYINTRAFRAFLKQVNAMSLKGISVIALLLLSPLALAASGSQYELTLSNHRFQPAELIIPVNTRVKLVVHNKDNNFEEFHSDSLHREKIISGNKSGIINIGPLPQGTYSFMGEFHADTAQGRIIVK
jgi:hypothetical protein